MMKYSPVIFRTLLASMLLVLALCSIKAEDAPKKIYTINNLPKVHLQDRTRYVCDPEHILNIADRDSIDKMLYQLEQKTGIESVVAVLPSIGDTDVFDFCHELLNKWGVGKRGADNGWVAVLVLDQKRIQFYTGYGLEGDLPDALCKRIQMNEMIPLFKKGEWGKGMVQGVKAVCHQLDGTKPYHKVNKKEDSSSILWITLGFLVICIIVSVIAIRNSKKCPVCHHASVMERDRVTIHRSGNKRIDRVTKVCSHCGYSYTVEETRYDNDNNNNGSGGSRGSDGWDTAAFLGGLFLGGGGRGGSGGGFGGGSFGGGAGGGGGAGSSW